MAKYLQPTVSAKISTANREDNLANLAANFQLQNRVPKGNKVKIDHLRPVQKNWYSTSTTTTKEREAAEKS